MPALNLLYSNADYSILEDLQAGGVSYGNEPGFKPEFTIQYEFGEVNRLDFGIQLSFFIKIFGIFGVYQHIYCCRISKICKYRFWECLRFYFIIIPKKSWLL
jgi:hypothetical protein